MRDGVICARTEVELGAGETEPVSLTCPNDAPQRLVVDPNAHVMMAGRDAATVELP